MSVTSRCFLRYESLPALGTGQVDPFQNQSKLSRFDFGALVVAFCFEHREFEASLLQSLVPYDQAGAVPEDRLYAVPPAIEKDVTLQPNAMIGCTSCPKNQYS